MKNLAIYILLIIIGSLLLLSQRPQKASSSPVSVQTAEIWRVTAYCPEKCCCGRFADGYTASGASAKGLIVAAPKDIPFGTKINIPGYGLATVEDRGGVIKGKRLDVLFPTHQEALNWGVKYLRIEFKP